MSWTTLLTTFSALSAAVSAVPTVRSTEHVVELKRVGTNPGSSRDLLASRVVRSARLTSVENGAGYAVPIKFGSQNFTVLFDTGSSDLWLPAKGFACEVPKGGAAPGTCGLEQRYQGSFSGGAIPNENFNISYGDGEFLLGSLGYESVSLAGLNVAKQEAALVSSGYFRGDNEINGLIGFAYPLLTSAFTGTTPDADSLLKNHAPYNPFFFTAIQEKLVNPVFSISLGRGTSASSLTLGGVPASASNARFATTALKKLKINPAITGSSGNFSYYTIVPQSYTLSEGGQSGTATAQVPMIVDSGTTLTYFPNQLAVEINNAFDPPSQYIEEEGVFENRCDATPPSFSVKIGGTDFAFDAGDLLLTGSGGKDRQTGGCLTGIQPGGTQGPFILGETFLKNVVAVFDIGNSQMRFAQK